MTDLTLRDRLMPIYDTIAPFVILNVLWIAVSLPIVTMFPATAALLYAMNRYLHAGSAGWNEFFTGLRRWFWRSYLWGGLNVLVIVILGSNILFYTQMQMAWAMVPTALAVALLVVWLVLQVFTFPLMLQQETPALRLALRNSVVILAKRPLRTLSYALVIGLIVAGSTFVFPAAWLFVSASLCAYLMNRATLAAIRGLLPQPGGSDPTL